MYKAMQHSQKDRCKYSFTQLVTCTAIILYYLMEMEMKFEMKVQTDGGKKSKKEAKFSPG